LAHEARVTALKSSGERHDLGNPRGWLKANIAFDGWLTKTLTPHKGPRKVEAEDKSELLTPTHPAVPRITKKMLSKAVMKTVELSKVEGGSWRKGFPSLLDQWQNFKRAPETSTPFLILYEEKARMYLVSGQERLDEFKAVGMKKVAAWVVKKETAR